LLSALRTLEVCLQILDATLPLLFSTPRDRKLPASIRRQNSVHDTLPGSDPGLTVHNLLIFLLLGTKPQLPWSLFLKGVRN
jgi:hypothetical protein